MRAVLRLALLMLIAALTWNVGSLLRELRAEGRPPPTRREAAEPRARSSSATRIVVASANIWQGRRKSLDDDLASRDFIAELARRNHAAYCARWGLEYHLLSGQVWKTREAMYKKMPHVLRLLRSGGDFTHVFWMDLDSIFTNFDVSLAELASPRADLVFTGEPGGLLNAGHFLLRNSSWSRRLIERVADAAEDPTRMCGWAHDQAALTHALTGGNCSIGAEGVTTAAECARATALLPADVRAHAACVPQWRMNSYPAWRMHGASAREFHWRPGHLVFHAPGPPGPVKARLLAAAIDGALDRAWMARLESNGTAAWGKDAMLAWLRSHATHPLLSANSLRPAAEP